MSESSRQELPSGDERARRVASSRALVVILFGWIGVFAVAALWISLQTPEGAELRKSPFHEWDGVWEGEFEGFNPAGERVTHLRVQQRYRHVVSDDQFRQEGHFTVTDIPSGEERQEKALNAADFDGTNLECTVYKRKGSVVEHYEGVKEDGVITWTRDIPGAKESFREWIEDDTYYIEGEGLYGDPETAEPLTFKAAYHRVEEE